MTVNQMIEQSLSTLNLDVDYLKNIKLEKTDPYIIYSEIGQVPGESYDDKEEYRELILQIDVYAINAYLVPELIPIIETNLGLYGFDVMPHGPDIYEDDTKKLHKPLNFKYIRRSDE